ncbi:hypothetical protein EXIGLDRAFT_729997 [Exidia glandulosa HHB12029]|uniref:F-box domain-containing protein n=1 Tax=Exidia glandulosa HHB12029 TaxID=1314781 RepID=A0A165CCQ6_EXIGL|nr:hypothetical protein EXIGLDRAFT_729997 [Exidia glandulosa HHB12029]
MAPDQDYELRRAVETALQLLSPGATVNSGKTRHMDHTYSAVVKAISALASSYNDQEPRVNRLPLEILVKIFAQLPTYELVTATHVCKYWRATAVAQVTLWNRIVTSSHAQLVCMLERSGTMLLDVTILGPNLMQDTLTACGVEDWRVGPGGASQGAGAYVLCSVLLAHMSRVRKLCVLSPMVLPAQGSAVYSALFSTPAPELVHFELQTFGPCTFGTESSLFDGCAPRLRYIAVCGPSLAIAALRHVHGLAHLEFTNTLMDLAEDEMSAIQHISDVTLHWDSMSRTSVSWYLVHTPAELIQATQRFLPPTHDLREIAFTESSIRVVHAKTGFVREIREMETEFLRPYAFHGGSVLVQLTVDEPTWRYVCGSHPPSLHEIIDLTVILVTLETWFPEYNPFLPGYPKAPSMPLLKRLTLQTSTQATIPFRFVSAALLATWLRSHFPSRPVLVLKDLVPRLDADDTYGDDALLEAVERLEYI